MKQIPGSGKWREATPRGKCETRGNLRGQLWGPLSPTDRNPWQVRHRSPSQGSPLARQAKHVHIRFSLGSRPWASVSRTDARVARTPRFLLHEVTGHFTGSSPETVPRTWQHGKLTNNEKSLVDPVPSGPRRHAEATKTPSSHPSAVRVCFT